MQFIEDTHFGYHYTRVLPLELQSTQDFLRRGLQVLVADPVYCDADIYYLRGLRLASELALLSIATPSDRKKD